MSIELILIPAAVAAVSAWRAKRAVDEDGRHVIAVATRMRDERLLRRALHDTHATVEDTAGVLTATWTQCQGRFTRTPDSIWTVHLVGDITPDRAAALAQDIDIAYGRHVQQAILARLKDRAPAAGMTIETETVEEDDTVTLVLNVGQGA